MTKELWPKSVQSSSDACHHARLLCCRRPQRWGRQRHCAGHELLKKLFAQQPMPCITRNDLWVQARAFNVDPLFESLPRWLEVVKVPWESLASRGLFHWVAVLLQKLMSKSIRG